VKILQMILNCAKLQMQKSWLCKPQFKNIEGNKR
jgi:hypothetical protein